MHETVLTLDQAEASPQAFWARRGRLARLATKRAIDVAVAGVGLLVLTPLCLLIAALIVLESPGPVFYRAERVGYRGQRLQMLKFRKMPVNSAGPALTLRHDRRLTRVGAALTRVRLDELPQLWHVLRGEMSLIGPRPESPCFVACQPDEYECILRVRPGLAGWSQLAFAEEPRILRADDPHHHYITALLPQKAQLDCKYAEVISIRRDLVIALWTLVAVVLRQPVAVNRRTGKLSLRRRPPGGHPAAAQSNDSAREGHFYADVVDDSLAACASPTQRHRAPALLGRSWHGLVPALRLN